MCSHVCSSVLEGGMMRAVVHAVVLGVLPPTLVFFQRENVCGPIPDEVYLAEKLEMMMPPISLSWCRSCVVVTAEIANSLYSIHPLGTVHVPDAAYTQVFFLLLYYKVR